MVAWCSPGRIRAVHATDTTEVAGPVHATAGSTLIDAVERVIVDE